ncbi:hypothetical protein JG688_00018044 [Phytophthora aleatoria]|uniref:RxLR effector protein n=1 Tax=Phytophthora aleatoria TaxID=2496075 RepID=A0A8J5MBS1_9STRA|nr:hypothetical protein JG688_00018044 [Phytophthora aleatoria]
MRLSYFLLVAATTLLASGSAATASGRFTSVSAMESPELTGMGQAIGSEKRSLRYHGNDDRADEEEDEENDDGEDREGVAILFSPEKLDQMVASVKRVSNGDDGGMVMVYKRFGEWKERAFHPYNLPDVIKKSKYDKLRLAYREWLYFESLLSI